MQENLKYIQTLLLHRLQQYIENLQASVNPVDLWHNSPGLSILEGRVQNLVTQHPSCRFPVAQRQGARPHGPGTIFQVCVLNVHFLGLHYICFYYNI